MNKLEDILSKIKANGMLFEERFLKLTDPKERKKHVRQIIDRIMHYADEHKFDQAEFSLVNLDVCVALSSMVFELMADATPIGISKKISLDILEELIDNFFDDANETSKHFLALKRLSMKASSND